jgi:peptide/nickel transport system substrate-binding protein
LKTTFHAAVVSLLVTILFTSAVPTIQAPSYGIYVTALDQETALEMSGVKFWYGGMIVWNPEKQIKELIGATGPFRTPQWIGPFDPCLELPIAFETNPQDYPELRARIQCHLNTFHDSVTSRIIGGALVDRNPSTQDYWPVEVWSLHNSEDVDADVVAEYGRAGAKIDKLRFMVIRSPDAKLIGMQTCAADVWSYHHAFCTAEALIFECPSEKRTSDIEKLDRECFTITKAPGFHVKFLGLNIRPDQSYRRPEITFWPLADVNFRHALVHCYDQEGIVASIKGYTATLVRSLVPPAQGGWVNPEVPAHPYNPGDPFTSTPSDGSSCGTLMAAGYTFIDAGTIGAVDSADYWLMPNEDPVPDLHVLTPTYAVCPTQFEYGARFIADLAEIGLAGTPENGWTGFIHEPMEYQTNLQLVYEDADFDIYMAGLALGRFPDHLYPMCYSGQDSQLHPWKFNAPGIHDSELDAKLETLKFSLDHMEKLEACWEIQRELYDENFPNSAFAYIPMYSRIYFNAFKPGFEGIVNSPGYGSDNTWTFLDIHWELGHPNERIEDSKRTVNWILCGEPERPLSPLYGYTAATWEIMVRTMDCLMKVNPYTHEDLPWMAESWEIVETPGGPGAMNITFHLRRDIFWQDGRPYTAEDAAFNWLFLRDNQIPRYQSMWEHIIDVEAVTNYEVRVCLDVTSQFLIYDLACTAAMLPPPVWKPWDGQPLENILAYDPSTDTTPPAHAGPWFGWRDPATGQPLGAVTCLYGTGPFIFDFYDTIGLYAEMHAWRCYWKMTDEIQDQLKEMRHHVGNVNYPGSYFESVYIEKGIGVDDYITIVDMALMARAYGKFSFEPWGVGWGLYNPDADINDDGVINTRDIAILTFFMGLNYHYSKFADVSPPPSPARVIVGTPQPPIVHVGDQFNVSIEIAGVVGLNTYEFTLSWDSTVVSLRSVVGGGFISEEDVRPNVVITGKDYVYVGDGLLTPTSQSGDGVFVKATFECIQASTGLTTLDLSSRLFDVDLNSMPRRDIDGRIRQRP